LSKELFSELSDALTKKTFSKDFGSLYSTKNTTKDVKYSQILIISLGKSVELTAERVRRVSSKILKFMKDKKISRATTNLFIKISRNAKDTHLIQELLGRAVSEGFILSGYIFDKYLSDKKDFKDVNLTIEFPKDKDFLKGFNTGKIIATNTNYAKDLVNEPAIVVTPQYLAKEALTLANKNKNVKVTILGKKELEQKGLNCILAVSKGSDLEPKLIIIEYNTAPKSEKIAIVGKGLTFDAGGYDIKPAGQFKDMKCDMSGGAAVLGTIKTAIDLDLSVNLIGVIPSCENIINGLAMKPGDVIKSYNGKTIEITHTDAEGRLILADAISYVEKNYSPKIIIDLATLTGACVVALGKYVSGMISNDESLSKELFESSNESYDRVWALPFYEEYKDNMDGDITDLRNTSAKAKGDAGAITGGVFLSKFVDKAKWAHIDIAGPAFLDEPKEYNQKYGSGSGIRLLSYYLIKKTG
jgi:leucyl aminopeptidase